MEKKSDVMENFPQNIKSVRIGSHIYTKKNEYEFHCPKAVYGLRNIGVYEMERMMELGVVTIEELEQTAEENIDETLSTLFGKDLAMEPVRAEEERQTCEELAKKAADEAEKAIVGFVDSITESDGGPGEVDPIMPNELVAEEPKSTVKKLQHDTDERMIASIIYLGHELFRDSENSEFVGSYYINNDATLVEKVRISFDMVDDLLANDEARIGASYRYTILEVGKSEPETEEVKEDKFDITKVDVVESKNGKLFFRKDFLFINPFTNKVYQEEEIEKFIELGTMTPVYKGEQDDRIRKISYGEISKLEDVINSLHLVVHNHHEIKDAFELTLSTNPKLQNMLDDLLKFVDYHRNVIKDEMGVWNKVYRKYPR